MPGCSSFNQSSLHAQALQQLQSSLAVPGVFIVKRAGDGSFMKTAFDYAPSIAVSMGGLKEPALMAYAPSSSSSSQPLHHDEISAGPSGLVAAKTLLHNAPAGEFTVSVFERQNGIGGLWPTSKSDTTRQIHPMMVANQSKHTMHFSDHAWEDAAPQLPRAWQVGRYLEAYKERYLDSNPGFSLRCNTRVVQARLNSSASASASASAWDVCLECNGEQQTRQFTHVVVASGHFGVPVVPEGISLAPAAAIPVIHSSQYKDLKSLLGNAASAKGKILIVGGQMSGVEIAGTIATHLSSATHSPKTSSPIPDIDQCSIHHVLQRPVWVFPLHTTVEVSRRNAATAPFLPLDFSSYNQNNRRAPLVNTHGHVDEKTAQNVHAIFQAALGTDQSIFSPQLQVTDKDKLDPPYLAVSDWYCDFVRSGLISLSTGKFASLDGHMAKLTDGSQISNVIAVVLATGFDPSPSISYLSPDILKALGHSPRHPEQPLALAFHGTHHPQVPNLGFVGFYRSPYWGVMQMHARFLAEYWSSSAAHHPEPLQQKLKHDNSIARTLALRDNPRLSQFPMGDYLFLMREFAEALSIPRVDFPLHGIPLLSHNNLPLDMLTPSRYTSPSDDAAAQEAAEKLRHNTVQTAIDGLTTPRFTPRAVFRSLLGTWKLERDLDSRLPTHPSGHFSGTAQFLLREKTPDGLRCAGQEGCDLSHSDEEGTGLEYLYVEDGEFKTDHGFGFRATRRYVWRYDEDKESLSVWFAKPNDATRADYLFHEIEFLQPDQGSDGDGDGDGDSGWTAKAGHLCIDDYYDVKYNFAFAAVNLKNWSIEYTVNGPKKDYTIRGNYSR
ncbi:hypothetical protein E4U21_006521 [Claviceps maximensis]|nr:hypothetical protein E4U21_006521 [Claviceps maximensis]